MDIVDFTLFLCNIIGIIPPINCRKCILNGKLYVYWVTFSIIIIVSFFGVTTYYRIIRVYTEMDGILSIVDQLSHTSFTLDNLLASFEITFFQNTFQVFFKNLTDYNGKTNWMDSLRNWKFFLIFSLGVLSTLCWDLVFWLRTLGIQDYLLYVLRSFQFFQNGLNVYLLVCICHALKNQMKQYNGKLTSLMLTGIKLDYLSSSASQKIVAADELKNLRKIQNSFMDLIPLYNRAFGRNIVLIIFNCIVNIILFTSIVLVTSMRQLDFQGIRPDIYFYITCSFWILQSLAFPILLATVCESTMSEIGKITTICLTYLNEIPTLPKTEELQLVKEELQMMCQQVQAKHVVFSAGGFFIVDYTMLGFMVGSVTSYIIVVMQFAK